jgi:hypothetical protein
VPEVFSSSFPALSVTRSFSHFEHGAGIRRFRGSTAALVTLSISLAILNHVSIFTLCNFIFCSLVVRHRFDAVPDPTPKLGAVHNIHCQILAYRKTCQAFLFF